MDTVIRVAVELLNLLTPGEAGVGSISWASSSKSQLRIGDAAVVMRRGVHLKPGFVSGGRSSRRIWSTTSRGSS